MTDPTLELADRLMSCPSVTPEDAGCMDLIIGERLQRSASIEFINRNGVTNLWARRGETAPLFVFAGHTDVVPTGPLEKWTSDPVRPGNPRRHALRARRRRHEVDRWPPRHRDEAFVAAHPDHAGSIAFLLTSDEEGDATDGTVAVVEALKARGETSRLLHRRRADLGRHARRHDQERPARLALRRADGQGHPGPHRLPAKGRNPIHQAAPAIAELAATEWDQGNEYFPPTTWQISNIHGGTGATNVVPAMSRSSSISASPRPARRKACSNACRAPSSTATAWNTRSNGRSAPAPS
jgi:succinyl-diaminopimelate desuccinylase